MLLVKTVGHRQRQLPQLVASAIQRFRAEFQHAANAAAGNLPFRHFADTVAAVIADGQTGRIAAGGDGFNLVGVVTLHQGQAVGERDRISIAVLLGHLHPHHLV
ncbi:hypothetical protein D3C73_1101480 [compost metagenome]